MAARDRKIAPTRARFPAVGRYPFWRVVEEWLRQRNVEAGVQVPELVDGRITLEQLVHAARLCEEDAPGEEMTPLEFVDWLSDLVRVHGQPRPPKPAAGRRELAGRPGRSPDKMLSVTAA
jgi:hypothetical protein